MTAAVEKIIEWCKENAFNIEGQDKTKIITIDYEELREQFDVWLELEIVRVSVS